MQGRTQGIVMRINNRLNLVIPVEQNGSVLFVHSMPISPETFDQHHLIIAKTFSAIYSEGLGAMSGPRIAGKILRDIAKKDGAWDGPLGVEAGVVKEIQRLSNVVIPDGGPAALDKKESPDVWRAPAWKTVTLHEALARDLIEEDDREVVENALVFFTVVSSMHTKGVLRGVMETVCGLWSAQTSLLSCTAFAASLPTSIATANSGETAPVSVHPS
jgi:hypothetical protein